MKPQYLYRWVNNHGVILLFKKVQLRRGDLFAQLIGSAEGIENPYALIEKMRGKGGLIRAHPVWITFDHDMAREILRDKRFGVGVPTMLAPRLGRRLLHRRPVPPNPVDPPSMLVIDQPEHTRMRKPVTAAFTPRAIARLRERIETVTAELLAMLPDDGPADLVAQYAAQVPIAIISEILGFPDADREMFLRWGDDISPLLDLGISWHTHQRAMESSERVHRYLMEHIDRLRAEPGDDVLSNLVTGSDLSTHELCASATLLMAAGFETTVNVIGKGITWLLRHPDQLSRLRAEPELWPNAVEEILRIDPPVQTTARTTRTTLEIGGIRLRAGSTVVLSLAGANRDPAVFTEPARFDITRNNANNHLSFSSGIHVCLGAGLARMEAVHALRALFETFPDLRSTDAPTRRPLFTLHGYERLPVHTGPRLRSHQPVG
ncbi:MULTISPECIES: cytochrome P450 [Nocardia]|uniref:Cytochrome P450 n=2 Tax=Nocardia TaxID=1817 RepID=A0A2T2ZD29_9NOCA|nr:MULTISPECIES: cytochrome P450 [Nocardia]MBF6447575.1 cytochrome P450 [Nocardia elegans]PSR65650.1 cytochrome P450 [Nocardia nova]